MTTISRSETRQLAAWNADKQQAYRAKHHDRLLTYHFLLDASPSMLGPPATNLRQAYNMYLAWLQHHADPMSLAEVRCFSTVLDVARPVPLGSLTPLTGQTYNPAEGNGTALYRAIGETCTTASPTGQHMLVVFTDGGDNTSEDFDWTSSKVSMLLQTLQEQREWLCVFLGAFPDALVIGKMMGFREGNCLVFASDKIPDAFQALQHATQHYLVASSQERKLLAARGLFA